jgi:hypothetical protein
MNKVAAELAIDGITTANSPNKTKAAPSKRKSVQKSCIDLVALSDVRLTSILAPRLRVQPKARDSRFSGCTAVPYSSGFGPVIVELS